jgi:hypothetical protein
MVGPKCQESPHRYLPGGLRCVAAASESPFRYPSPRLTSLCWCSSSQQPQDPRVVKREVATCASALKHVADCICVDRCIGENRCIVSE